MCPACRSPRWSALTAGKVHLGPFQGGCGAITDQNQAGLGKPMSKNRYMEHPVLSPSCGLIHSPAAPLPGTPLAAVAQAFGDERAPKGV